MTPAVVDQTAVRTPALEPRVPQTSTEESAPWSGTGTEQEKATNLQLERDRKRKVIVRSDKSLANKESLKSSSDVPVISVMSPVPSPSAIPPVPIPSPHTSDPNAIATLETKFDRKFELLVNSMAQLGDSVRALMDHEKSAQSEVLMDKNLDSTELDWTLHPKQHQRIIVHIDIDCFYAQVEMVRNPELRNKPMGVKQKFLMVTSNYTARALGVKKQMYVTEALKVLPELILIDGSDLTPYRQCSNEISSIAQTFTPHVERMGLDENFIDITDKVRESCESCNGEIVGHFYGDKEISNVTQSDPCGCGCYKRLIVGTQIASDLRKEIFEKTGITCCAGIAHNKVLAKMVSGYHKPNQQTVIFPWQVCELMNSLDHVKSIPGIGSVTSKTLEELNISSVQALQRANEKILRTRFDEETCRKLRNLSFGIDEGLVRGSVRPQSLGIEDAFTVTKVTSYEIIKSKYKALLERLLKLLADDGRIPLSLKVVVRKSDGIIKFGPRESKQIPLSGSFFSKGSSNNFIDPDVFNSLPKDIQEEVLVNYKATSNLDVKSETVVTELPVTIPYNKKGNNRSSFESYFMQGIKQHSSDALPDNKQKNPREEKKDAITKISPCSSRASYLGNERNPENEHSPLSFKKFTEDIKFNDADRELLDSVDYDVFNALPEELQKEILDEKRSQRTNSGLQRAVDLQSTTQRNVQSSPILKYFKKI
ncbi:DNA polymerase iota-like [Macrobrachium rosenbergii]|uniref:DNA polymerase iota-like n=1 Tax=Macrobrachium rosenbergii TaxID=79674 RepID=UPI0034D4F348